MVYSKKQKTENNMPQLDKFTYFVKKLLSLVAFFLGNSLGSEVTITGKNLVLLGILLFFLISIFGLFRNLLTKKYIFFPLVFLINACLFFLISLFFYHLRDYALSSLFSSLVIFGMVSGGGQPPSLPAPSGQSSSVVSVPQDEIWAALDQKARDNPSANQFPPLGNSEREQEAESSTGHPPQEHPGDHRSLEAWARLIENHEAVANLVQKIFQDLHTRVPGGFQAERLAEILEERHGGEKMTEIRHSLQTEGHQSPYFREIQTDFRSLRDSGGTEMQLRKEWQGRA